MGLATASANFVIELGLVGFVDHFHIYFLDRIGRLFFILHTMIHNLLKCSA